MDRTGRIIRGAVLGIALGIIGGIGLANMLYAKKSLAPKDKVVEVFETEVAQVVTDANLNPPECSSLDDCVLRFHVKANSNSRQDIALKYAVRDAVLAKFGGDLEKNTSMQEAVDFISDNLTRIEEIAVKTIYEAGYSYPVKVYIANDYFPIRQYGDMVFPAGEYKSLRIDIGEAKGENFWCILYPMTCYTYDSAAVLTDEDEKKFEDKLSREDYERLFVKRDVKKDEVKLGLKLFKWLGL